MPEVSWDAWLKAFDEVVTRKMGISLHDLPDSNYPRTYYDGGTSPEDAWEFFVEDVLYEEGFREFE